MLEVSSSQQQISSSLLQVSASYISLSGSYTTFSGSASTRITANSSSIQQVSSSQQQISASLLNVVANYATTGSNSFRANQSITGSLVVSSTITAQTLVVQTVTSSIVYSSGSNLFGNQLSNTQTFTGSVNITGSLMTTGNVTTTGISYIGNDVTNSSLVFKTGGSTNYSAIISTNSNVDQFNILGGSTAGYDNGSSIGLVGADRYGTKTAGMLTLSAGNAVNNTAYGYISMNTGNTERLKITYAGNIGIGITNPDANLVIGNLNTAGKGSVNGASGTINRLIVNCPYPGASALTLAYYSSAYGLDIWVNGDGTGLAPIYFDQRQTEAIIFRRSTYGTAAESMRITGGGYVGIGTTSPTNTLQVNGNIRYGSIGLIRNTTVTLNGNSTTGDVFRFLDSNGTLLGNGAIAGTFHVVAYDTATGGNQTQYEIRLLSGGNGTGNASLTVVSNLTRGTAPMANLTLVNDGSGGGVKIQGTTAASGVTGAILWINFIGNVV